MSMSISISVFVPVSASVSMSMYVFRGTGLCRPGYGSVSPGVRVCCAALWSPWSRRGLSVSLSQSGEKYVCHDSNVWAKAKWQLCTNVAVFSTCGYHSPTRTEPRTSEPRTTKYRKRPNFKRLKLKHDPTSKKRHELWHLNIFISKNENPELYSVQLLTYKKYIDSYMQIWNWNDEKITKFSVVLEKIHHHWFCHKSGRERGYIRKFGEQSVPKAFSFIFLYQCYTLSKVFIWQL
jgi:hypothetical protein